MSRKSLDLDEAASLMDELSIQGGDIEVVPSVRTSLLRHDSTSRSTSSRTQSYSEQQRVSRHSSRRSYDTTTSLSGQASPGVVPVDFPPIISSTATRDITTPPPPPPPQSPPPADEPIVDSNVTTPTYGVHGSPFTRTVTTVSTTRPLSPGREGSLRSASGDRVRPASVVGAEQAGAESPEDGPLLAYKRNSLKVLAEARLRKMVMQGRGLRLNGTQWDAQCCEPRSALWPQLLFVMLRVACNMLDT